MMIKSAGIYFASRVSAALCGLLAVAIYTRLMTPESYGVFSLVMTGAMTLFAVCFHWIQSAVLRFLPAEDGVRPPSLGAALAGFVVVAAVVGLLAGVVVLHELVPVSADLVLLGVLVATAYAGFEISLAVVHARQRPAAYALVLAARAVGSLLLGSLALIAGYGVAGLLVGVLLAHCLPAIAVAIHWWHRLVVQRFDWPGVKRMATFGLPLAIVGIAASVIGISDRYLLALLVGVDAAGTYAAPYDLAQRSLQIVMLSAFLALSPAVFRSFELDDGTGLQRQLLQQARLLLVSALPVATIMAAAAPLIARLLFGAEFRDAAAVLIPWIVVATLVQGIQSYYYSYCFTLAKRTLANAGIVIAGALLNIVLNLLLIPMFGPLGAAAATLASLVVVLAATLILTRHWLPLPWPTADMLKIVGACLAAAPFIGMAARAPDLLSAVGLTGLAAVILVALLVAIDAAATRTAALDFLAARKRRLSQTMVTQS
jgi:O-antigen/teichoic acid export membrane protein